MVENVLLLEIIEIIAQFAQLESVSDKKILEILVRDVVFKVLPPFYSTFLHE